MGVPGKKNYKFVPEKKKTILIDMGGGGGLGAQAPPSSPQGPPEPPISINIGGALGGPHEKIQFWKKKTIVFFFRNT